MLFEVVFYLREAARFGILMVSCLGLLGGLLVEHESSSTSARLMNLRSRLQRHGAPVGVVQMGRAARTHTLIQSLLISKPRLTARF